MIEIVNENGEEIKIENEKKGFNSKIVLASVTAAIIGAGLLWKKFGKKKKQNSDLDWSEFDEDEASEGDIFDDEETEETES